MRRLWRERRTPVCIILSAAIITLCFLYYKFTGYLYFQLDSYYMAHVAASFYSESNWCVLLNPFFCLLLKGLTALYDGGDWFTLILELGVFAGAWWMLFCVLRNEKTAVLQKITLAVWLVFCLVRLNIWCANFTVQAAFYSFAGYMTLFSACSGVKRKNLIGILFVVLGIWLRAEAAILFLPFVALKLIARRIRSRGEGAARTGSIRTAAVCAAAILLFLGSYYGIQKLPGYEEPARYNAARALLEDYPTRSWEELPEQDQFDETDYIAAQAWYLLDRENMTTEKLEIMADYGTRPANYFDVVKYLTDLYLELRNWDGYYIYMWMWLMYLFFCVMFTDRGWTVRAEAILAILGAGVICAWFIHLGRAPARVTDSVGFACYFSLMCECWEQEQTGRKRALAVPDVLCALVLTVVMGQAAARSEFRPAQWALTANTGNQEIASQEMPGEGDVLYISGFRGQNIMDAGKMIPKETLHHYITHGDWTYGQPYHDGMLQSIGAANPARALLERDNTWYVAYDSEFLLRYLRLYYGEDIQHRQIGELNGIPCWQFYREGENGNEAG